MRSQKIGNAHSTDSLQQKLLSTRYSIVDEMMTVRDSIEKQQKMRKSQSLKIEQLHKKILKLENAQKYNSKVANQYYGKLQKLQNSQNMAIALLGMKVANYKQKQQNLSKKRELCTSFRFGLQESKQKALKVFERRKTARIQKFKQQQLQYYYEKQRRSQSDMEHRRNKSSQIRQSQMLGRQRLKRYEQFKLAQARFNYDQKKQQLLRNHADKLNQLKSLQSKVDEEQEMFRKTQVLNEEVSQIQTMYITGL